MRRKLAKNEIEAIIKIEAALVRGDYESISCEAGRSRLSKTEIENALKPYSGMVTFAPEYILNSLEAIAVGEDDSGKLAVDFDLWIDGRQSDLTLSMSLHQQPSNREVEVFIEDLHTL